MKMYLIKTISLLLISTIVIAQSKDEKTYKERAAEVQQEIWESDDNAFNVSVIPDKYKNASAVIIARSVEVTNSTKRKFKMVTIFGGTVKQYKYFTSIREKVLINDKAALEDFSTLNYQKKIDYSIRTGGLTYKNIYKTFIGVKIYKQSGKVITINPDNEEVLTKNTDKNKQGKLAIPDLQTGDILDYYIRIEELVEFTAEIRGPDIFYLAGEYPMLYYNVKYILDKKCGVDVMSMNGAKPISENTNTDGDIVLEFTEKDQPAVSASIWTSPIRQIPYHVIRYGFPGADIIAGKGEVKRGPFTDIYKANLKERFINQIRGRVIDFSPQKKLEEYFGGKKNMKDLPPDSIVNSLLNYYHWDQYGTFRNMKVSTMRNYESLNWLNLAVSFSENLREYDIDNDIVLVRSRYAGRLKEVFGLWDFETVVKINGRGKLNWVCFTDFFVNPGQIPAKYQGEEGLLLTREGKDKKPRYADAEAPVKLPFTKSNENTLIENLTVNFSKENIQLITIERNVKETGIMKEDDQKKLILAEDAEANLATLFKKKKTTDYTAASDKKGKELAVEIQAALDKERLKQKDYFIADVKEQYGQEPKDFLSYKIINNGFSIHAPSFDFTEKFIFDNFVKKAGNNFIFEAGRLMGTYKKTEEKDRARKLDIYMPAARTLTYSFAITLPDGYTAKGIDALNKQVENDIASFVSTAAQSGNTITINVSRIYKNSFEPASNWPKLLQVMDAAADFTEKKILLEKIK